MWWDAFVGGVKGGSTRTTDDDDDAKTNGTVPCRAYGALRPPKLLLVSSTTDDGNVRSNSILSQTVC